VPPDTPWIGLAALAAMFLLPFLPGWLFEGPRTVKHYPRRHVCGYCHAPWTPDHLCLSDWNRTEVTRLTGQLTRPRRALSRRSPRTRE
jgi:hypothetical protein